MITIFGLNRAVTQASGKYSVITSFTKNENLSKNFFKEVPEIRKGSTKVLLKKQNGIIRFTASQDKVYRFKVSNIKGNDGKAINGTVSIYKYASFPQNKGFLESQVFTTYGGESRYLSLANKKFIGEYYKRGVHEKKQIDEYKTSRTALIKLKKGETIYIRGYFTSEGRESSSQYNISLY